ncbi:MAG: hypothetical protein BYD32DRAFT_467453 [Podila humilis]|nr:MAG: hypothetical protein BYD32DRAFT_467453 [Podila humilis]
MTIAAAAGLVAGSTFTSYTTVYADENNGEEEQSGFDHDHRARLFKKFHDEAPDTSTLTSTSSSSRNYTSDKSGDSPRREYKRTHFINQRPMISQEEELMPGLVYVALAGLTGSLVARQRGILAKMFTPAVFASAAGVYFMPHRTQSLLGLSNDKPRSTTSSSSSYSSTETLKPRELISMSREAWHTAEVKTDSASQEVKHWWNKSTSKAEDKVNGQLNDAKAWVDLKTKKADKVLDNVSTHATEAAKTVKEWIGDKASRVDLAYDSEPQQHLGSEHKKYWWSSRSKDASGSSGPATGGFFSLSNSPDYWSNGEEQGTAKIREDEGGYWFGNRTYQHGHLDNKDVDRWSSTNEEMGTARIDENHASGMHLHHGGLFSDGHEYVRLPHEPEYWSNGEEVSSASIRDANYYNWPGGVGPSLSRTSWWDRGLSGTTSTTSTHIESDIDSSLAALKSRAERVARDAKDAADMAARDIASRLAYEQDLLAKQSADARTHAEAALQQAKATGDALLRERHLAMEKRTKDLEARLKLERDAADRAATDAKNKALAWEREQQEKANKTIHEISDKVAHDKAAAEKTSAEIKAKADTWAREQREKAEKASKGIHDRVLRDAAAAEKTTAVAKAALDAKIREEKLRLERTAKDYDERIRLQKLKEEKAAADLYAQVGSFDRLQKEKVDQATKELEEKIAYENSQKLAREAQIQAEAAILERRRIEERELRIQAEKAAAEARARLELAASEQRRVEEEARIKAEARSRGQMDGLKTELRETTKAAGTRAGWSWPWSSSTSTSTTTSTSTKHTHDREGFDSTGHLMEHIVEDIRQTKEDFQGGLSHLKETVLGAENKAAGVTEKTRETVREAVNAPTPERSSWWSSGTSTLESNENAAVNLGHNVEATAVKAEKDVEKRADTVGKDRTETARKAYDNVIDAATTVTGQSIHGHHHHDHNLSHSDDDGHTLIDHIAEDLKQTQKDLQSGVDSLKDVAFGAEKAANEAVNDMSAKVEEVKQEGRQWWSAKTHEAEKTASRLDAELKAGLDRAGSKVRELERGIDENLSAAEREAAEDEYWYRGEENHQQQQRRGGRAM